MNNKISLTIFLSCIIWGFTLTAQNETHNPGSYGKLNPPIYVPSIAQQIKDGTFIDADIPNEPKKGHPKGRGANITVPGKGLPKGNDELAQIQQRTQLREGKDPFLVFDANVAYYTPSDPTGAVGPNHFVGAWNVGFRIFDKEGNPLTPTASLGTLFPGNEIGDPIVFYDAEADRFVITEFDNNPNGFNMAVCEGSDPVNDGWYIYTTGFETGEFPDYTKFSVWSDGYYVTANISATDKVFVVERDEMLQGNTPQFVSFPLPGIVTSGFYSPQFFNVTDSDLPPTGNATLVYMQDDAWAGVSEDHIKLWTVNVDWDDITSSTISDPLEIETTPFISVFDGGSFSNVPQPSGQDQDVLQATIMNQAQYRRFSDHNSAIFNFVVDTDGGTDELAGIRWFELRQVNHGDPWTIYQEGTYISPYNGKNAFSGSMVMDEQGNIGMGYTTCSATEMISVNYTGRYSADPLGVMTVDETLIAESTGNNPSNRLADYVQLSVDPVDGKTFWHIAEYFTSLGRTDVVGVFQIASDFADDVGVTNITNPITGELSEEEQITITIYNYGTNTQIDIPVCYTVDQGSSVNEIFEGPLASGESAQYTFSATANLGDVGNTYEITAYTNMSNDEFRENDTITSSVFYMYPNDLGVVDIIKPVSGTGLSDENVVVTITNFGTAEQSDFDVSYSFEGNVVTEQVPEHVTQGSSIDYTFNQQAIFSNFGEYDFAAYTSLPGDADHSNDTTTSTILNSMCQPEANCESGDGFYYFAVGDIENESGCSPDGYSDYTNLITELEINSINELTVTTHYGDQYVKVWIDFNDNFVFESNEVVINNMIIAYGQASGVFTKNADLIIPGDAFLGQHMMRAKSNWNAIVPDDACEGTEYGETEDYMVDIVMHLDLNEIPLQNSELVVKTLNKDVYNISLDKTDTDEVLYIEVHDVLGQKLVQNKVRKSNGKYEYMLDMSFAEPGAYIVRLGNRSYGKIAKIIVQ